MHSEAPHGTQDGCQGAIACMAAVARHTARAVAQTFKHRAGHMDQPGAVYFSSACALRKMPRGEKSTCHDDDGNAPCHEKTCGLMYAGDSGRAR